MIDLRNHYGFTRTPFGRDLAPGMLHRHPAHAEAGARITWCAGERGIGVITGEVGAGKTVSARAVMAGLDLPGTPSFTWPNRRSAPGAPRPLIIALGGRPDRGNARLAAQAAGMLAAERGERGRSRSWSSTKRMP